MDRKFFFFLFSWPTMWRRRDTTARRFVRTRESTGPAPDSFTANSAASITSRVISRQDNGKAGSEGDRWSHRRRRRRRSSRDLAERCPQTDATFRRTANIDGGRFSYTPALRLSPPPQSFASVAIPTYNTNVIPKIRTRVCVWVSVCTNGHRNYEIHTTVYVRATSHDKSTFE